MPVSLPKDLRNQLSRVTLAARDRAEAAAKAALENLAVHESDYRSHMTVEVRQLRNRLRARGRALGDKKDEAKGSQEIRRLIELVAYENWHRLLFTRFLTENNLLISDEENGSVPVTLADCEELASSLNARDGFELACRFAARILPGVFRSDDPALEVTLAPNDRIALKQLLDSLPAEIFRADDALGWTYQFWQAKRKDEVNASGNKIGADEISPVTQLFTEDYMVEFLLHNTIGAWWAGRCAQVQSSRFKVQNCPDEKDARRHAGLAAKNGMPGIEWTYLRFVKDKEEKNWIPAGGTFEGWPKTAREIRFLDPCMGSGHFIVFALPIIARLRMEGENLSAAKAVYATLQDNIFGLEIDERCTQIAAFNVALTAWKIGGYQKLPQLHLACSGIAPQAKLQDWVKLAGDDDKAKRGMERLYKLFEQAPILGSLIDPTAIHEVKDKTQQQDLLTASFEELKPLLEKALKDEKADETRHEMAVSAQGIEKAAEILSGKFTVVGTNVPYLGRNRQDVVLQDFCSKVFSESKSDLAACFVERCLDFNVSEGTVSLVTPQSWLFQERYAALRKRLLISIQWQFVTQLGARAFETITGERVNVSLLGLIKRKPSDQFNVIGLNVDRASTVETKAMAIESDSIVTILQKEICLNPDARIVLEKMGDETLLVSIANSWQGIKTSDDERFTQMFWERTINNGGWWFYQRVSDGNILFSGRQEIIFWENGNGKLTEVCQEGASFRGKSAWEKRGVAVSMMGDLPATLYAGEKFSADVSIIEARNKSHLVAAWTFCSSTKYALEVRKIDRALRVTNSAMAKIPFDLPHWQRVALEKYPHGLPSPFSNDPTQWLFHGHPCGSVIWDEKTKKLAHGKLRTDNTVLQVAVARLLGYTWPAETDEKMELAKEQREWVKKTKSLLRHADHDGIVCLSGLNREQPAAARLRALLGDAYGGNFDERALISSTGSDKTTLEEWLRDEFFEQHCKLFHHRPFIWHIWDGRKDGFHVLVNYHKLDHANLQKLTYSHLGDWIRTQDADAKADKPGAAERLGAARALQTELANIIKGEPPYDIFVRWKPLSQQTTGWHPDLNDGVRLNIRPFMLAKDVGKKGAGILRSKPNIKWDKDRGKEPTRDKKEYPWFWCEEEPGTDPIGGKEFFGNRWNGVHLTLEYKRKAR